MASSAWPFIKAQIIKAQSDGFLEQSLDDVINLLRIGLALGLFHDLTYEKPH